MKKIIVIVFCQLFLSINLYSQTYVNSSYKNCIKAFYSMLFKGKATVGELAKFYSDGGIDNEAQQFIADSLKRNYYNQELINKKRSSISNATPSYILKDIQLYFSQLTFGLNLNEIDRLIETAKIYNQGDLMIDYIELNFPNGKKLYFNLNTDTPTQITGIWLNNGDSLEGKRYNNNPEKLFLVGTINDPDGYVNIREKPSPNSKIVSKITLNNYFYYMPNGDSDWYPIKVKENARIIGYIHKSRIKNYTEFSNKLKQRVIKELTE